MSSCRMLLPLAATLFAWGLLASDAAAQYRNVSMSIGSDAALHRLGLVRVWQAQIDFDVNRGKLAGIAQYISNHTAQTIYEVTYPGGRLTFSDRDLDAFNRPLGPRGAKEKAEEWIANWKARTRSTVEPEINEIVVPDVVLVATSFTGTVQCLDAETGRTLWTTRVGNMRHPTTSPAVNEKHVAVVNGSTLFLLSRADGSVVWQRTTKHVVGDGPAMSDDLVFVPTLDGHMETYSIDQPRRPVASFQSIGRCLVQPVVFRDAVAWPTDRANLYVGNSEVPGIRFRITSQELANSRRASIRSAPTFRDGIGDTPPLVFFASSDGYLYVAETLKGSIVNRFSAGEPISQSPVVVGDQVYVVTDNGTLFCVGADNGQERWSLTGAKTFLAANYDRLYCLDRNNRVLGVDARTGGPLGAINVGSVDYSFLNTQSDRIYLSSASGGLQCLRETRQTYPLVHAGLEPKKQFQKLNQGGDEPAEEDDPAMEKPDTPDVDPFADPADAPADMPEEMPEDMPAEEDPFGE